MSFQSDFYDYLLADVELAAAVGDDAFGTAKVYHLQVPEAEDPPYLFFQKISGDNVHSYDGGSALASAFYQFDCVGLVSTGDAETIYEALRHRLDGHQGTIGSTALRAAFVNTHRETVEDPGDASESWIARIIAEVEVWYVQTAPTG